MNQLPQLYDENLKKQFSEPQYLMLLILINLLQNVGTVKLEELARSFQYPILLRSRIRKIQRFLSLPQFNVKTLWLPIFELWIKQRYYPGQALYIVIDRSQWRNINLLMVSLVYRRRSIPIYFALLLTNLPNLSAATNAYAKRMGIEEMFRDFKSGGYNLEATRVNNQRLISLILLICLSYTIATFAGENIKQKGVASYVTRPSSTKRTYPRHSSFSIGLHGNFWVNQMSFLPELIQELLRFSRHKLPYHLKGLRAMFLIQSAF
jgi:hypothetical protein